MFLTHVFPKNYNKLPKLFHLNKQNIKQKKKTIKNKNKTNKNKINTREKG